MKLTSKIISSSLVSVCALLVGCAGGPQGSYSEWYTLGYWDSAVPECQELGYLEIPRGFTFGGPDAANTYYRNTTAGYRQYFSVVPEGYDRGWRDWSYHRRHDNTLKACQVILEQWGSVTHHFESSAWPYDGRSLGPYVPIPRYEYVPPALGTLGNPITVWSIN